MDDPLDDFDWDYDPCVDCPHSSYCDGWEAQFCCTKCQADFGWDESMCVDCDPWEI